MTKWNINDQTFGNTRILNCSVAIELKFIHFVIRKSTLEKKYLGGVAQSKADLSNRSLRKNEQLIRFGCMNRNNMEFFTDVVIKNGLEYQD